MFAICVNTSCNLNKSIEHERACVMVLVNFEANGKNHSYLCCYSVSTGIINYKYHTYLFVQLRLNNQDGCLFMEPCAPSSLVGKSSLLSYLDFPS